MIERIFSSRVGSKILMYIGRRPFKEFYLNELSKELKIGLGRTRTILDDLAKGRILLKRKSGNRYLFKLNPNNQLAFEIIRLANLNALFKLPDRFRLSLGRIVEKYKEILGDNVVSIILFGSVAKGTAKRWSDVDIFIIVRHKPGKKTYEIAMEVDSEISDVFSETLQDHLRTQNDFIKDYRIGDDFLINIMIDGIVLFDRENFFSEHLLKGIPEVTKKSIKLRLDFSKKRLEECEMFFDKTPESSASMLSGASISIARAILLLNHMIPGSKHDIPKQLESIREGKLAKAYKKTRIWFDELPLEIDKDEARDTMIFLKEKYREASRLLEDWS